MKAVLVNVGGTPTVGDTILLYHTTPRGGRSIGGYVIKEGDTLSSVASSLVDSCKSGFSGGFEFKVKEGKITIMCSDSVSDAILIPEVLGAKTETLTVEEL
jgi:hypothetical protein